MAPMLRVVQVMARAALDRARATDRVVLDAYERHRRRIVLTAERGTRVLLDLPHAARLGDGDGLVLEDGSIVLVVGRPEPLVEISVATETERMRLAWHLGNRHTDVQVVGDRLRMRRDPVIEDMVRGLGGTLTLLDAPFDPEGGAYGHAHSEHGVDDREGGDRESGRDHQDHPRGHDRHRYHHDHET